MKKIIILLLVVFLIISIGLNISAINDSDIENTEERVEYLEQKNHYTLIKHTYMNENKEKRINYPLLENFRGELLQDYINQDIEKLVSSYENSTLYTSFQIDYTIHKSDDDYLSILFIGIGEIKSLSKKVNIMKSLTFDLKTSNEINFANFIINPIGLKTILEKVEGKRLEYEGINVYFDKNEAVFYYMPLDDSAKNFTQISVPFDKLKSVATFDFGKKPAS